MQKQFENFSKFYQYTLQRVCYQHEHYHAPRGHSEREIVGYCARLNSPRERFCLNRLRRQNIVFNFAEALWYLSGKNDLAFIAWYAPSMARYSADGISLPGTGYGARLKHFGNHDVDQIERAIDILRHDDSDSKRIVLQIYSAEEDLYRRNIDVSCTLGLQLMLREGRLHMVGFMRANDAYVGMLNDIFSFTFLQEYIAVRLGCELGHYTHQVGSVHVYDDTYHRAAAVLEHNDWLPLDNAVPVMPSDTTAEAITRVLVYEAEIRNGERDAQQIMQLDIASYWRDVLMLFWVYREIKCGNSLSREVLTNIHAFYRPFVLNRWGDLNTNAPLQEVK